jgi:hypothetical protein
VLLIFGTPKNGAMNLYIKFNKNHQHKSRQFEKDEIASVSKSLRDQFVKEKVAQDSTANDYYAWKKVPAPKVEETTIPEAPTKS